MNLFVSVTLDKFAAVVQREYPPTSAPGLAQGLRSHLRRDSPRDSAHICAGTRRGARSHLRRDSPRDSAHICAGTCPGARSHLCRDSPRDSAHICGWTYAFRYSDMAMEHVGAFTQIWREICKFDDDGGRSFVTVEQV